DLREHQKTVVYSGTVAILLIGETIVAVGPLKVRIARCLTRLYAVEERLERSVQSGEHILQHLGVDVAVFGPHLLDGGQLGALASGADAHPALLPGITALLQGSIVEFAAATQDKRQRAFLLSCGLECGLDCLAQGESFYFILFCLAGMN